jgi:hypothetical protein
MGEIEAHALAREAIERRRRRAAAVNAEGIGAERIDGDQEDVLAGDGSQINLSRSSRTSDRGQKTCRYTDTFNSQLSTLKTLMKLQVSRITVLES